MMAAFSMTIKNTEEILMRLVSVLLFIMTLFMLTACGKTASPLEGHWQGPAFGSVVDVRFEGNIMTTHLGKKTVEYHREGSMIFVLEASGEGQQFEIVDSDTIIIHYVLKNEKDVTQKRME